MMTLGEGTPVGARQDKAAGTQESPAARPPSKIPRQPLGKMRGHVTWAQAAKRGVRRAVVTANRPTHQARLRPSFLIVGAARCGTTTMFRALGDHPAVFRPIMQKEVHYFDNNYHRGPGWYQSTFPLRSRAQRMTREAGLTPVTFESTPYYMFHPLAGERILRDLPGVKLLVMLRDPVERARSSHSYSVTLGYETESFPRALELEDERLEGEAERLAADPTYASHAHRHFSYRARSRYSEQLEHLEKLFGRERIYVVDSDDFFANPEPSYDKVLDFLGLPNRGYPPFEQRNSRPRHPMDPGVRASLEEHFQPYDERLVSWLGHEPSWRR
jgi:hypothetical protein